MPIEFPGPEEPHPPLGRTRHPYFMHEMVRRQSVAGRATYRATCESLGTNAEPPPSGQLLAMGLGTSFHAALAAGHALRPVLEGRADVRVRTSFDLLEEAAPPPARSTALVFTASGETALTNAALGWLKARGTRTVVVSARETSTAAAAADRLLLTQYADETSWTHTVSFTAALVAIGVLAEHWAHPGTELPAVEDDIADAFTAAIATENSVVELVDRFADRDRYILSGAGYGEAAAREGALKLREAAGRFCAAVGTEEFLHGVIPSANDKTAVIAVATSPAQRTRAEQGLRAVSLVGAKTLLLDVSGGAPGDGVLTVPPAPRPIPTALAVVPLQLLAYWTATAEGRNPDVMGLDDVRYLAARRTFGI